MADILIAIKPKYANLILNRKKKVEVRRRGSSIQPGDRLVIYSSSPEKKVVGTCEVRDVIVETPVELFRRLGSGTCLTKGEFETYLEGTSRGVGIGVKRVRRFAKPIGLSTLRQELGGFSVPQSYRFLLGNEVKAIVPWS